MTKLVVTLILLFSFNSQGKTLDYAPTTTLASSTEMSVLEMYCTGTPPFKTMTCEFTQKAIRTNRTAVDNAIESNKKLKIEDLSTDKEVKRICELAKSKDLPSHELPSVNEVYKNQIAFQKKICDCRTKKDLDCAKEAIVDQAKIEQRTCKIATTNYKLEFNKISDKKWMNTPTPQGLCKVVNAMTLEWDGNFKWTYTQTRLSADSDSELCKSLDVLKPVVYKTGDMIHKVDCEYIDLSPSL